MKKFLFVFVLLISGTNLYSQCVGNCTTVTGTIQDSSTQLWVNAIVTATIIPPFGNPSQLLNNGVPINDPSNIFITDSSGTFTFSLDNNSLVSPAGSQWKFNICPNATVAVCTAITVGISGTTMDISSQINSFILPPIVNAAPTIYRAYSDTEAKAGQGAVYWRVNDNTLRGCPLTLCNGSGWTGIGGGGGGGGSNSAPPQFGVQYASNGIGGFAAINPPATPSGILQLIGYVPTGSTIAPATYPPGLNTRTVTGTTDTISTIDCNPTFVDYIGTASTSVTLPTPSSLGVTQCDLVGVNNTTGTLSTVTFTPTTWTCNGAANCQVAINNRFSLIPDPKGTTNWLLFTQPELTPPPVSNGFPASPQVGDIVRYNVNGDTAWDAVNYAQNVSGIYAVWGGAPIATGPMVTGLATLGSGSNVNPTATAGAGHTSTSAATASTSTVIGDTTGQNGNNSVTGMLAFYKWSFKFAAGNTTNVRYWMGLGSFNSSGTGNNTLAILGSTAYANDTPNKTTLGFRFSSTTDTVWQAVAAVAGGSQTISSTGVAIDTNPHVFEMATNITGTTITYYIDGTLVSTIFTNLPNPAAGANSWGNMFWSGDNKNTATAISGTLYSMQISLK
jgi:hypothetical protein